MSNITATNTNTQAAALLFIHAQTSLHPGSGTALGWWTYPSSANATHNGR